MPLAITAFAWVALAAGLALLVFALWGLRSQPAGECAGTCNAPPVERGTIHIVRPSKQSVEGLEIQYERYGLVRSVRVGAMNSEHKELLLTMDAVAWRAMPNAQKQEVLAAARSTWAAKMCPDGPDIAYVVVKTDCGDIVGRASPRSVTIV